MRNWLNTNADEPDIFPRAGPRLSARAVRHIVMVVMEGIAVMDSRLLCSRIEARRPPIHWHHRDHSMRHSPSRSRDPGTVTRPVHAAITSAP